MRPPPSPWLCLLILSAPLVSGCATTELAGSWQKPGSSDRRYDKIVVIGVAHREDVRRLFEDQLCGKLQAAGVQAIPGYTLVPEAVANDRAKVTQAIESAGANAVLITRLVNAGLPTAVSPDDLHPVYGGYYGYYRLAQIGPYQPPVVYQSEIVILETRLFDTRQEDLIWTGTTRTFDPQNTQRDTADLAQVIVKDLKKRQLI